jgi:hypothetical protein
VHVLLLAVLPIQIWEVAQHRQPCRPCANNHKRPITKSEWSVLPWQAGHKKRILNTSNRK